MAEGSHGSDERRWFLLSQDIVRGPYSEDEVLAESTRVPGPMIWGRGQGDWMPPEKWRKQTQTATSQTTNFTQTSTRLQGPERMWRVRADNAELPPMPYDQMIQTLKARDGQYDDVWIWTEGYSEWRDVFKIHRVMDELNVGRRSHPRVPLAGQVLCEGASGAFVGRALSISEGGLGMTEVPTLKIGEKFKIILKSPNLDTALHATAEVVYVGNDGYAGIKFIGLQADSKAAIIEYVRNFSEQVTLPKG